MLSFDGDINMAAKSYNDIKAQAQRIIDTYPEQMKRRWLDRQTVWQIGARVRAARGIGMFCTDRNRKYELKQKRNTTA